jgi:hypothetical protein
MNNMNDIDDLMRQKFEADIPSERFVFREEYWEQARALLEQADREKRRRWLLFLLLVGACLLGLLYFFANRHLHATGNDLPSRIQPAQPIAAEKAAPLAIPNQPDRSPEPAMLQTSIAAAGTKGQQLDKIERKTKTNQVASTAAPTTSIVQQTPTEISKAPAATSETADAPLEPNAETEPALLRTDLIAVVCQPLTLPAREHQPPANLPTVAQKPTKIATNKRWAMSLALARTQYRYPPADTSLRSGGWAIGTMAEYKLSGKLALTMGLQWRITPGYSPFSPNSSANNAYSVSELTTYSFGFKRHKWEYRTKALNYVEIPLGFRWQPANWSLEAGGSVNILARVQNIEHYTLSTSLDQMAAERSSIKNGAKRLYTQAGYGAYAGIGYQFGKRTSGFVRGQYRFSPVFAPEFEFFDDGHLISLDFGLRYRFL